MIPSSLLLLLTRSFFDDAVSERTEDKSRHFYLIFKTSLVNLGTVYYSRLPSSLTFLKNNSELIEKCSNSFLWYDQFHLGLWFLYKCYWYEIWYKKNIRGLFCFSIYFSNTDYIFSPRTQVLNTMFWNILILKLSLFA